MGNGTSQNKGVTIAPRDDVDWSGALKKHNCTDIICFILFIVFLGLWGAVGIFSMLNGDINKVVKPNEHIQLQETFYLTDFGNNI